MASKINRNTTGYLFIIAICICVEWLTIGVLGQLPIEINSQRPCEYKRAIDLPSTGRCLVPVKSAYNWTRAQSLCRLARGTLYETPWDLQNSNRELLNCLSSMTDPTLADMWINSIAQWQPQFSWVNNTVVNKIEYCTRERPQSNGELRHSITLSIDYCVYSCYESTARHVVIYNTANSSYCYCVYQLPDRYQIPCDTDRMSYTNTTHSFIATTFEKPLLRVAQGSGISNGEMLCGAVDTDTYDTREIQSRPCAERHRFLCNLGNSADCSQTTCNGRGCLLKWKDVCLWRVDYSLNWYEARSQCNETGGDLWVLDNINDMRELNTNLDRRTSYWIGVSNFQTLANANSASLERYGANYQRVRCGHLEMVQEVSRWQWSSTTCDQPKAFLCQFNEVTAHGPRKERWKATAKTMSPADKDSFQEDEQGRQVVCPWPTPITSRPIILPRPTVTPVVDNDDSSFPIAALISGLVAALILLTCIAVSCAYCTRRRWFYGRYTEKDQVAFVPYVTEPPEPLFITNGHEMDRISHGDRIRSASSLSESGSQFGQVKPLQYHSSSYSQTGMESYTNGGAVFSSKSLDRNLLAARDNRRGMDANTSYDERGFVSSYSTLPIKPRDYMILEGQMNIQEEAALRGSIRGKPEVTLVTDHADMNFTINHASPHGHNGSERSSLERTLDEIHVPVHEGNMTLTVPERVAEARSVTSMSSMTKY